MPTNEDQQALASLLRVNEAALHEAFQRSKTLRKIQGIAPNRAHVGLFALMSKALQSANGMPESALNLLAEARNKKQHSLALPRLPKLGAFLKCLFPVNETIVAQDQLKFSWEEPKSPVSGFRLTVYEVKSLKTIVNWTEKSSPCSYPSSAPALKPSTDYGWYVEALTADGQILLRSEPAVVRVLSEDQKARLQEVQRDLEFVEREVCLLVAVHFEFYGILSEARVFYSRLTELGDPASAAMGWAGLGGISERQGLEKEASQYYHKANALLGASSEELMGSA